MINKFKKIVIKIGSSSIVNENNKKIKTSWLRSICDDIKSIHSNKEIVIVCSGAIALGTKFINKKEPIRRLEDKQAAAAIGQIELAKCWQQALKKKEIQTAQILLTLNDSEVRRRYLNVRKTINALHKKGIIPIINENDSVATEEIRFGDNDRLAARVAQMIDAELLILLTDVDGLYSDSPKQNKKAKKILEVFKVDSKIEKMAKKNFSNFGTGGMVTKIWAAKICMNSGCSTVISSSNKNRPLLDISKLNSTWFNTKKTPKSNRKQWLLNHLHTSGSIIVDQGALKALINNKSLLPAGVLEIKGHFKRGDVISILSEKNIKLGIGIIAYDSSDAKRIIGKNSNDIKDILGYEGRDELIHKDDLVKVNNE